MVCNKCGSKITEERQEMFPDVKFCTYCDCGVRSRMTIDLRGIAALDLIYADRGEKSHKLKGCRIR